MRKTKVVTSNVQTNHSLGEYQRYFSHLLKKGTLKRYSLKEKQKLNPERQYWLIKDEKGNSYYYELPRYVRPDSSKTAYSMNRVMHRRPARIALAIFAGVAVLSFTSAVVTKAVFASSFPDVPPQPIDLDEMQRKLKAFQDWKKDNPTGDATNAFTISELTTIGMANALYDSNYIEGVGYNRRPLLTIGYGGTTSIGFITVDVTNAFVFDGEKALEESISYSTFVLPVVPQVGRRDFYFENEQRVESNPGVSIAHADANWDDKVDREFSKDDYIEEVGKVPDNPFLYSVDEETVLSGSSAKKKDDGTGYVIDINLDTVKGVARYVKRMKYLSGKQATKFYKVNLHFEADNNLFLTSSKVNESYLVDGAFDTQGELSTKFYYQDIPPVPARTDKFNYGPYPKNI